MHQLRNEMDNNVFMTDSSVIEDCSEDILRLPASDDTADNRLVNNILAYSLKVEAKELDN